ncbi:MAG TPA: hypothetical protein VLT90_12250 [Terriglobales bacterium]|nr:hypothetical protein [Terriglobales bacterium]
MKTSKGRLAAWSVLLAAALIGYAFQIHAGKLNVKSGEEYYVCDCAKLCCETISSKAGKCGCGHDLVKATVTKVEKNKAYFKAAGWDKDRAYKTEGKYACDCGSACDCKTISQKPGKCGCGHDLKKV